MSETLKFANTIAGAGIGTSISPGWGSVIGAGIGLAGDLFGGLFGANSAQAANREQMKYNAYQAALTRNWLERMSNTAHQREVKDLRAAGLNPILSATGGSGASTPASSAASVGQMNVPKWDFSSALQAYSAMRDIERSDLLAEAEVNLKNSQALSTIQAMKQDVRRLALDKSLLADRKEGRLWQGTENQLDRSLRREIALMESADRNRSRIVDIDIANARRALERERLGFDRMRYRTDNYWRARMFGQSERQFLLDQFNPMQLFRGSASFNYHMSK